MKRRILLAGTAAVALGLIAAACGDDDTADEPAATDAAATDAAATDAPATDAPAASGTVTIYSGRSEELVKPVLDEFSEETGISVEFRGGQSGELAAQLITEGDASPADVFFSQDAGALGAVEDEGLFAELPGEVLALVPETYRSASGRWVGTSARVRVFIVNPELAPDPPTTIDELLEPQWKGKLGFAPTNASWQSFVTGLRVLRGEDGAREWLEAFSAQDPVAFENNNLIRDAVDAGEVSVGLVNHYYLYEKIAAEGADAVVAKNVYVDAGDPGGLVNVAGMGILASSDHQDAALALAKYLLGETAQTYFAEETFEYPLIAGVSPAAELPSLESLGAPEIDLSDLDSLAETQELLADVGLLTL